MPQRAILTPLDWWCAGVETAAVLAEAQIAVTLRIMSIYGVAPPAAASRGPRAKAAHTKHQGVAS